MASVGEQLAHAQQQDLSLPDVRVLLAAVLQKSKAWLYAYPEYTLTASEQAFFAEKLAALQAGYPLPYLLGEWEFYCLPFNVSPAVLIPRPETELLVETALNWAANRSPKLPLRFGDVGTGSGCIAVTLAYHLPHAQGWRSTLRQERAQLRKPTPTATKLPPVYRSCPAIYCSTSPFRSICYAPICPILRLMSLVHSQLPNTNHCWHWLVGNRMVCNWCENY